LQRDFTAPARCRKWLTDIAAYGRAIGWLYLAVVLDDYSRLIVGWAMAQASRGEPDEGGWRWASATRMKSCCTIPTAAESHTSLASQAELAQFRIPVSTRDMERQGRQLVSPR
jgi:hypothetical protein